MSDAELIQALIEEVEHLHGELVDVANWSEDSFAVPSVDAELLIEARLRVAQLERKEIEALPEGA